VGCAFGLVVRGRRPRSERSTYTAKADGYELSLYGYRRDAFAARQFFDLGPSLGAKGEVDLVVDRPGRVQFSLEGVRVLAVRMGVYEECISHKVCRVPVLARSWWR